MPRPSDPSLQKLWQARLNRYHRGELTIAEFCRREGVSEANFYLWKKKLGGHATPLAQPSQATAPRFVPLLVTGHAMPSLATLRLPGGASIELSARIEREQLADLLAACIAATKQVTDTEVRQ